MASLIQGNNSQVISCIPCKVVPDVGIVADTVKQHHGLRVLIPPLKIM
jgi:hypothetical protein